MSQPTIAVQAVIPGDAAPDLTSIGHTAVTVHPAGTVSALSLHWASLDALEAWVIDLRTQVFNEKIRRADARLALNEAHDALVKAGVR